MTTWIITTGNSDIQLNTDANWTRGKGLFKKAKNNEPLCNCQGEGADFANLKRENDTKRFPVAARVLGLVYQDHEHCYSDLVFPLLDVLIQAFQDQEFPDRVYIILTDQEKLFKTSDIKNSSCPFWQDTCTLKPLFEWYFQTKLKLKPDFITLQPSDKDKDKDKGLDHWDQVLTLVTKKLTKIQQDDVFYISHQASTPAISSAVQFVSIGYFSNVKFLIVNRYYEENNIKTSPEIIPSSSYWKQLQIQKAKKLITDGFPGSALALLKEVGYNNSEKEKIKELERYIDLFNMKTIDTGDEFDPTQAIKRVRETLDLIEYFLKQENYLQAIILLSAAQETFLKASISLYLQKHIPGGFKEWNEKGLSLNLKETKIQEVIKQLQSSNQRNYKFQSPHELFPLLKEFTKTVDNDYWQLLIWSSIRDREHEFDRRNQLMHNLRGVKKEEVILYLTDPKKLIDLNQNDSNLPNKVDEVYRNEIKGKFISALETLCGWTENDYTPLKHHLEELAKSL
ncbi:MULTISPECIES: hypothetical protein [Microcystis]|uniref:Uncharacterized protein n=1 Tax=Microcystis viridis FACHB-1342 TaxID=2692900 RepID=A0ABR8GBC1_MICVR|nr:MULTISPECIES: hypothetical protein [Microcystis]MBD2600633.1 hypothetical protein [Microcystis viridis FACHB-1342]MDB9388006.1 hypothetical protein [Microcystis aeruginosa CS-583]ODV39633.1 hypothetical protein BFG60_0917 [Microcystis aeruginosa NIES-98]